MASKKSGCLGTILSFVFVIIIIFVFRGVVGGVSTAIGDAINGNQKKELLVNVPEEYKDNYYFKWFGGGSCEAMTGNIHVTMVFVDDSIGQWDSEGKTKYMTEAKARGVTLNITVSYKTARNSTSTLSISNYTDWVKSAIESAELPSQSQMGTKLEKEHEVDHAPVIFCANRDGRCFAKPSDRPKVGEYAVLYDDTDSLYHEFCHIFGAMDFYYPEEVKELANTHLEGSVMNSGGKKVDDLTAFLIGWTDTLTENAKSFLSGTNHITESYMKSQHADETYTGYVEEKLIGDTVYTGKLVDGILEGKGRKERDGTVWEGTFKGGLLNGQGSYSDKEGNKYVGDFLDGKRHGKGTYTWANGSVYTGSFVNGKMSGQGTIKWPSGDTYSGAFVDGQRHGKGTYKWATGGVYTGDFVNGKRTGQGTYKWTNGDTYVGEFLDGKLNGYGTLTYANGKVRKGNWQDGKFVG